jgi:hypothetical protein
MLICLAAVVAAHLAGLTRPEEPRRASAEGSDADASDSATRG